MTNPYTCNCKKFLPLQLLRDQITLRIKETKNILITLDELGKAAGGNVLYKCNICGQFWQRSSAWNWSGKNYLFQVPATDVADWKAEQYVSPADILIYNASMEDYFGRNKFTESKDNCRVEGCNSKAIVGDVVCKKHLIENFQKNGILPKEPTGKIFEPYT